MAKKKKTKKKYKKEPSLRIRRVFKKVLDSKGKVSVSKAMREEGYPATTAKNPQQMTRTRSWQQLLQEYLPDESLSKAHEQLLNAFNLGHQVFPLVVEDEEIIELLASTNCTVIKIKYGTQAKHVYFWAPDNLSRDRALDKAYKLKGKYKPQKIKFIDEYADISKEEIEEELERRKLRRSGKKPSSKRKS